MLAPSDDDHVGFSTYKAWEDVLACHRIAGHLSNSALGIEWIVGLAVRSVAHDATVLCIADASTTPDELRRRWRTLEPALGVGDRELIARFNRLCMLDSYLGLVSGHISSNSANFEADGEVLQRLVKKTGDINDFLKQCNAYHDEYARARSLSTYAARRDAAEKLDDKLSGESLEALEVFVTERAARAYVMKAVALIDLSEETRAARHQASCNLIHAAFGAQLHYRESGRDVRDGRELAKITAKLAKEIGLPDAPELSDPFTNAPLLVRVSEAELLIYSVGVNRNDDGGKGYSEGTQSDDLVVRLPRGR